MKAKAGYSSAGQKKTNGEVLLLLFVIPFRTVMPQFTPELSQLH